MLWMAEFLFICWTTWQVPIPQRPDRTNTMRFIKGNATIRFCSLPLFCFTLVPFYAFYFLYCLVPRDWKNWPQSPESPSGWKNHFHTIFLNGHLAQNFEWASSRDCLLSNGSRSKIYRRTFLSMLKNNLIILTLYSIHRSLFFHENDKEHREENWWLSFLEVDRTGNEVIMMHQLVWRWWGWRSTQYKLSSPWCDWRGRVWYVGLRNTKY